MKKYSIALKIFLVAFFHILCSCEGYREKRYTPRVFLNHSVIDKERYSKDSIEVLNRLNGFLARREDFFHPKSYFDSTQVIIDSIIYAPDFNKLAVFVIAKIPISRQLIPDKNAKWYYDATCYLGVRRSDSIDLNWIGPSFTNAIDRALLSGTIREYYFTEFATEDTVGLNTYKYNLNDVRFWQSSIWNKIEVNKMRKMEFNNEKTKHPENVYEPKQ